MAVDAWQAGTSGDWSNAGDWGGGVPSSSSTASIGGTAAYVVTLTGSGACAALTMAAANAEFYLSGALTLSGTLALQSGTFALAGALDGGTLALLGGNFLAADGVLNGVAVDGPLVLGQAEATLFVQNGISLAGASGSGAGSLAVTGAYASVDFVGSQSLNNVSVTLGSLGGFGAASLAVSAAAGASTGATLTLGSAVTVQDMAGQAALVAGTVGGVAPLPAVLVNNGVITASNAGSTLSVLGSGTLVNQGTIAASNGAALDLGMQGLQNSGVISVNNATLELGGIFSASLFSSLGSVVLSGATVSLAGTAALGGGTLSVGAGTAITGSLGALSLTGEIANGVVRDSGGGIAFTGAGGTLSGVTYSGDLLLSAAGAGVTLANGASVTNGSVAVTGAGAALLLQGSETLSGVAITLGAAGLPSVLGTSDAFLASTATTATLGPGTVLTQAGQYALLEANGFSPFPGIGLDDTLVNAGRIAAGFSGGTLSVSGYGTFINQGGMTVSGGDMLVDSAAIFANAGTLTVGAGGVAVLGQNAGVYGLSAVWSNAGLLSLTGGTLVLQGAFSTSAMGSISESGGVLQIAGTLNNAGSTLTLGAAAGLSAVSLSGTIAGGVIQDSSAALTVAAGATLVNVTDQGTLSLSGARAVLDASGGLYVVGLMQDTGAGAMLDCLGSQALVMQQCQIGANGTAASIDIVHNYAVLGPSVLTLGAVDRITQAGQLAAIGTAQQIAGDGIVNKGTITAGVAGGTFTLGGQGFSNLGAITASNGDTLAIAASAFSNGGAITVTNASLQLAGSLSLAALGQLNLNNASIGVSGTLDLGGGTLSVGAGASWGNVALSGTLANGIISDSGGGLISSGGADLSGITYQGMLSLSRPFSVLRFSQGLTVLPAAGLGSGSILVTGAQSSLIASGSETLNACTVTIGSAAQYYGPQRLNAPELAAAAGVQLVLGSAAVVNTTGLISQLGDLSLGDWTDSIINDGAVSTSVGGNTLTLDSTVFDNAGVLSASSGAVLWVADAQLVNTGTLALGQGAVAQVSLFDYFEAPHAGPTILTNSGTIAMAGGTLHEMTANGLFPGVPLANTASGQILGTGAVIAPVSNAGTIEAVGGMLSIAGSVSGSGSLLIGAGATLDLTSAVTAGEVVSFTSATGTLMLNQANLFAGAIANFTQGDVIDLPGQTMTFLALSNGTLAVNTPTQQFLLAGAAPLAGALLGGPDGRGGAMIDYVPRAPGLTTLGVTEPHMLFWTTPAGDDLIGSSANMRGAELCNWCNNSKLDVTDLNPGAATLSVVNASGFTTLTASDGSHAFALTFAATIAPVVFGVAADGHGGSFITT